ncbi:MAG: arsenosugar biosynthesis radical SAM (seleno)protein ArsS [Thermoplasmatota archaeon]
MMDRAGEHTNSFDQRVIEVTGERLSTKDIHTIQVNVGKLCNQSCTHCHHEASPDRTDEVMDWDTMSRVIEVAKVSRAHIIDITGGAPEMNPSIRKFVKELKKNGHHVMLRTNLTALLEEGAEDLPEFYRNYKLELIASLPCYELEEVDCVRGNGVFDRSIQALKVLNSLGYGKDPELKLNLVFNPMAAFLPPPQQALKEEYDRKLEEKFGIVFNDLFTITNMPIGRFAKDLKKEGKFDGYMELLRESFNPGTISNLMCLYQISVGWDGTLHDCDFNQAIGLKVHEDQPVNIKDIEGGSLTPRRIVTAEHCFGCTAGAGSSCCGSLVDD